MTVCGELSDSVYGSSVSVCGEFSDCVCVGRSVTVCG